MLAAKVYNNESIDKNTNNSATSLKCVKKYEKKSSTRGQLIEKIASELFFVDFKAIIKDVVEDFNKLINTKVIAVVNEENSNKIIGIIERKNLFNILSKPFGRDILIKKSIEDVLKNEILKDIVTEIPYFYVEQNIFSILPHIQESLEARDIVYFFIVKTNKEFAGIFTNFDILFYLSSITQQDLKIAKQIHTNIVKEKLSISEEKFSCIAGSQMATGIGGDYYIFEKIHNTNMWILGICDISGKGVSAALVSTLMAGFFNLFDFSFKLSYFLKKINTYIFNTFNMEKYLTGIFIKFDSETGKIKLFDMGHGYAYLFRGNSLHKFKNHENNIPIGFVPEINPQSIHFNLKKGDILILFTDGMIEQPNMENSQYGINRIFEIIKKNKDDNFEKILEILFEDIKKFRGYYPQHDDITIVLLKYNG